MALADLAAMGLVERDSSQVYQLTEGRKQALRDTMVRAIDEMVDGLTYGQLEGRTRQLLLVMGRGG